MVYISFNDLLMKYFSAEQIKKFLKKIGETYHDDKQEAVDLIESEWEKHGNSKYDVFKKIDMEMFRQLCKDYSIDSKGKRNELIKRVKKKKLLGTDLQPVGNNKLRNVIFLSLFFSAIAITGIVIIAIDIPFLLDPQTIPIQRSYVFAETSWSEKEEKTLLTVLYFFDMNGTIKLHTTSRSAQNPINVEMILLPYNLEKPSSPERFAEILPETLTFVFPAAMVPGDENIQYPKKVEVSLKKELSPLLRYIGTGQIEYENEDEYEFYLKERATMQEGTKESVTLKFEFNPDEDESRLVMAELAASADEKIIIEPFSQTINLEAKKSTAIFSYLAIVVTVGIFVIKDYRKKI